MSQLKNDALMCIGVYSKCSTTKGLEDVSKYPALFAELLKRGYSDGDLAKISRLNIIRVLGEAEEVGYTAYLAFYIAHYLVCR